MTGWRRPSAEIKERGGKLINVYVTLGRYDVVEIFEAPDDETALGIVLELARHGAEHDRDAARLHARRGRSDRPERLI